jgi:hypothetical protein
MSATQTTLKNIVLLAQVIRSSNGSYDIRRQAAALGQIGQLNRRDIKDAVLTIAVGDTNKTFVGRAVAIEIRANQLLEAGA